MKIFLVNLLTVDKRCLKKEINLYSKLFYCFGECIYVRKLFYANNLFKETKRNKCHDNYKIS